MLKKALLSLVAGLVVLLLMLLLVPGGGRPSDFSLFVGRFHPVLVHLPIGILFIGVVLELFSRRWNTLRQPVLILLFAGAWTSVLAAVAGLYLAQGGGYDPITLAWHKRLGVLIAIMASAAFGLKSWADIAQRPAPMSEDRAYLGTVVALALCVGLAGHWGSRLTHGDQYLTRYLPDGVRRLAGLPAKQDIGKLRIEDPATTTAYDALIAPVLREKCASCHREDRARGGLAVDTPEALTAGGDNGPVIVPGRANESELIHRIWLPLHADGHMPPASSPQLTVAEAELIRWWIDGGSTFELTVADAQRTPIVQTILDGYGLNELQTGIFALNVAHADAEDIAALEVLGAAITPLAEDMPYLQVRCINPDACITNEFARGLRKVARNVAWLDLSHTRVDDALLDVVQHLPHLTRLYLQQTEITDTGLSALSRLEYLEYLNLYGTSVSNSGVGALTNLSSLRSLYLWQTNVTADGVAELQSTAPNLYINTGLSLAPVDTTSGFVKGE